MPLALRDGFHFCIANDRTVFLDLVRDRYFCLPPTQDQLFKSIIAASPRHASREIAESLASVLIERPAASFVRPVAVARPVSEVHAYDSVYLPDLIIAVAYHLDTVRRLRRLSLHTVLDGLKKQKDLAYACPRPASAIPEHFSTVFAAASRLLSKHDQCLRCSIAFVRFCAGRGYYPDLVIGVRMYPFRAHAWVQAGDRVLNDTVDNVAPYTPILVV